MAITIGLLNTTNFYFTFAGGTGGTGGTSGDGGTSGGDGTSGTYGGGGTSGTYGGSSGTPDDTIMVVNRLREQVTFNSYTIIDPGTSFVSRSSGYGCYTPTRANITMAAYDENGNLISSNTSESPYIVDANY